MIRSRLHEHYSRVLREDMLTLFNRPATLRNLECSVVLNGASMLSSETKYRAACILEILTGQRVSGATCEVGLEDPLRKTITEEQQRDLDKVRGAALRQSMMAAAAAKSKKGGGKAGAGNGGQVSLTSEDLRKLGNGFKLKTVLEGVSMFHFLEKCREFYLPDVVGTTSIPDKTVLPTCGHPNHMKHSYVTGHFEKFSPAFTARKSLKTYENPSVASTSYLLRSSDLLKFPDIELFFESMGSLVSREGTDDTTTLHLILRPTIKVDPLSNSIDGLGEIDREMGQVDHLKVMNYLLSHFFNTYMRRPRISGQ